MDARDVSSQGRTTAVCCRMDGHALEPVAMPPEVAAALAGYATAEG